MRDTLSDLRDAAANGDDATRARDDLIRVARAEGLSLRKIAEAAGMSHEQVRRIIAREPEAASA